MVRGRIAVAAVAGVLLVSTAPVGTAPVGAHDHSVPRTVLRDRGQRLQRGTIVSFCWASKSEDGNVVLCADGLFSWKKAPRVRAGNTVRIRIFKKQLPETFALRAWEKVNVNDIPVGGGEQVEFRMRPYKKDGKVIARDFLFTPEEPGRHYYVTAAGTWPDRNDPALLQDALWTFHLRTRRAAQ